MDHGRPYSLLVIVCVYEEKKSLSIKSVDINKNFPTLISMEVATPPVSPLCRYVQYFARNLYFLVCEIPRGIERTRRVIAY